MVSVFYTFWFIFFIGFCCYSLFWLWNVSSKIRFIADCRSLVILLSLSLDPSQTCATIHPKGGGGGRGGRRTEGRNWNTRSTDRLRCNADLFGMWATPSAIIPERNFESIYWRFTRKAPNTISKPGERRMRIVWELRTAMIITEWGRIKRIKSHDHVLQPGLSFQAVQRIR